MRALSDINDPDIILITETWASSIKIDDSLLSLASKYSVFRADRAEREGGGCAILVRCSIPCRFVANYSSSGFEFLVVELLLKYKILLACAYRRPSLNLPDTITSLQKLQSFLFNHTNVIVGGDFNFPGINWNDNSSIDSVGYEFLDFVFKEGLEQRVCFPTRKNKILDLLLIRPSFIVEEVRVTSNFSTSDHRSVQFLINSSAPKIPKMLCRNFRSGNYDAINLILNSVQWDVEFSYLPSLDLKYQYFLSTLLRCMDSYIPFHSLSKQFVRYPSYIRKLLREKKKAYRKHLSEHYKLLAKRASKAIKRFLNNVDRLALSGPIKKLYRFVSNRLKCKECIPPLSLKDENLAVEDKSKASAFAIQFTSAFSSHKIVGAPPINPRKKATTSISDIEFTVDKVCTALSSMPFKNSNTPDFLPHFILKKAAFFIAKPVTTIFRESLDSGVLPLLWSTSFVIPIFKKGDRHDVKNYRPIALTCLLCRVFEAFVSEFLLSHLLSNNLISSDQFGFLSRRSTTAQLLTCITDWFEAIQLHCQIDCIYVDFAKAFDSVPIQLLINKVESYGVKGKLLRWISAFLNNRTFRVKVNNDYSEVYKIHSGVPQGSVLGPLLFLLYINDLPNCIPEGVTIKMFADDVKLYVSNPAASDAHSLLQKALNCLHDWSLTWKLPLSVPKCNVLHVTNVKSALVLRNYTINNELLPAVETIRDLEVTVDSQLTFKRHINNIIRKSYFVARQLLTALRTVEIDTYSKAFKIYVRPLLEYACQIWSPHFQLDIARLEKVQKYYTRISAKKCHLQKTSYENRMSIMGLEKLESRRLKADLLLVRKLLSGQVDLGGRQLFTLSKRKRGHCLQIYKKRFGNLNQYWFTHRVVNPWNNLPRSVIDAKSVGSFRRRLNKALSSANFCT